MNTTEEVNDSSVKMKSLSRDKAYEFTSPKCYDLVIGETKEDEQRSELWLVESSSSSSNDPSSSIHRIKAKRNLSEDEEDKSLKARESFNSVIDEEDNKENIPPPPSHTKDYNQKQPMSSARSRTKRSVLMPISQLKSFQTKTTNKTIMKREARVQDNQAIKRQKLEGGKSRQILNPKPITLPHKTKLGLVNSSFDLLPSIQTHNQSRPMTLTRPNEPEFATSHRIRPLKLKSTVELEEEMLGKMPKFKPRPLNKKRNDWRPRLTEPKSPLLQTMLRAPPTKIRTSTEIEQEELEKVPKFKATPFNKKIFESRAAMGIFSSTKKHVTTSQEFHFVTDERISRPSSVVDLFDKLSLNSDSCRDKPLQRNTTPNPFLLRTEERGAMKASKFMTEVTLKQTEDKRVRIPKAIPYPYTTDYPVVPPKPEPKRCTKPEPFQLESLARHEEEMRKAMEERMRIEKEEAQRRIFRAQPMIKEDPIPVPEKVRKPLTEIQEFNHHVDHRAVERADFDHKIKEKEMMYKRYREETEAAKMVEEDRALKQLRRTMVPHARPVPNFNNPFLPQKSNKENTKPKSPKLRVISRIEWRKMMASSSTHTR